MVQAPYAIASPAAIFASGAKNKTIKPNIIKAAPSQEVLSFMRASIHFLIICKFPYLAFERLNSCILCSNFFF